VAVTIPARLTWKDQRGATRFASVVVRNLSEFGAYVESLSPVAISLFRVAQLQFERDVRRMPEVPASVREGRMLSAVYRITRPSHPDGTHGLALRLLVDPKRQASAGRTVDPARATA
jgi:hypothetical protein